MYPVMANGIRTGDTCGFNKGCSSTFCEGSRVRQTPEEGRRTYQPKCFGNNNKDEDNSPKTLNDKNQKDSSQKFKQLISSEEITIKMKTIDQKPLMIKINKLRLRNLNN